MARLQGGEAVKIQSDTLKVNRVLLPSVTVAATIKPPVYNADGSKRHHECVMLSTAPVYGPVRDSREQITLTREACIAAVKLLIHAFDVTMGELTNGD
jgi:hypothetical protein